MTKLSHIEINVSDYPKSIRFYDLILIPLGWKKLICTQDCTTYSDGAMKLILSPTDEKYKSAGFHRKRIGLNHLAFPANLITGLIRLRVTMFQFEWANKKREIFAEVGGI